MESIELLKQEILNQKQEIENKGGVVNVSNLNPSPAEITAGIKSIESPDFSSATATEEDVVLGKTFYAGNNSLKTGTNNLNKDFIESMYLNIPTNIVYNFTLPEETITLKPYAFNSNPNTVNFIFNENIETIDVRAFEGVKNFNFVNFSELQNIKALNDYCFSQTALNNIDLSNLPASIEYIGLGAFKNSIPENAQIRLPKNIKNVDSQAFYNETRVNCKDIDLSNYPTTKLESHLLYNLMFDCDLIIPEGITEIGLYFAYNACFHNIEIPSTVISISANAFNQNQSETTASDLYLKTITFKCETPPSIHKTSFSALHTQNDIKVYVPDNAVDAYKAVSNFSAFKNYIYPMSEKN